MTSVCSRMAQPQLGTMWAYIHFSQRKSGRAIMPSQPKSTTARRSGSAPVMPGTGTASRSDSAFGPTYRRASVAPLRLPTAAPSTSTLSICLVSEPGCGISIALRKVTSAALLGSCGTKIAAKYWSDTPAQWNGPGRVPPPLIFFDVQAFDLVIVLVNDLAERILCAGRISAEASRPHGKGRDGGAFDLDGSLHAHHITTVIKRVGLFNRYVPVGIGKLNFIRRGCSILPRTWRRGGRHVEHRVELVSQGLVIRPQGQRISVLLRRGCIH